MEKALDRVIASVQKVTRRRMARFFFELKTLLDAGVSVRRSLLVLYQSEDEPALRVVLGSLMAQVESGSKLSEALRAHVGVFGGFACGMMEVGDRVGYSRVLREVCRALERQEDVREKIAVSLRYPILVMVASCAMTFVLMRWVVPGMLAGVHYPEGVPWPTRLLGAAVSVVSSPLSLSLLVGAVGALSWLAACYLRRPLVRLRVEELLVCLPVVGRVMTVAGQIQICHTLSAQLKCGVMMTSALRLSADTCTSALWRNLALRAEVAVRQGREVTEAFALQKPSHASLFLGMLSLGDRVGELPRALDRAAYLLEEEFGYALGSMASLAGPVMLVLSAGLTLLVLLGALLPLHQLSRVL